MQALIIKNINKKILLLYLFLLPWVAAAQDEIRTAVGDTVMRKVLRIERYEFFNTKPQLILEKSGEYILPRKVPFTYMKSIRFPDGCEVSLTLPKKESCGLLQPG